MGELTPLPLFSSWPLPRVLLIRDGVGELTPLPLFSSWPLPRVLLIRDGVGELTPLPLALLSSWPPPRVPRVRDGVGELTPLPRALLSAWNQVGPHSFGPRTSKCLSCHVCLLSLRPDSSSLQFSQIFLRKERNPKKGKLCILGCPLKKDVENVAGRIISPLTLCPKDSVPI